VLEATQYLIPIGVAALGASLVTPVAAILARRFGVVDRPNERKVSDRAGMPVLGGLSVLVGCVLGLVAAQLVVDEPGDLQRQVGFMVGGVLLFALGVWDDRFDLSAWPKLAVQAVAAAIAIWAGFRIDFISDPVTGTTHALPEWLVWIVTITWITGVTNALNLVDGLDGLTAGLGAIISATLGFICWEAGHPTGTLIALAMMGALAGYLPFNFPPARIFLGDNGALFIGYALAVCAVDGYRKTALLAFAVPLLALAIPLLDMVLSVVRRMRAGRGIFTADSGHMHHQLLRKEGSHRGAVLTLYFLTACFCLIAVSFARLQGWVALFYLGAVIVVTIRLLRNLGVLTPPDDAGESESRDFGDSSVTTGTPGVEGDKA